MRKEYSIKTISTLVEDIYGVLDRGRETSPSPLHLGDFEIAMKGHLSKALMRREDNRTKGKMWFSDLGEHCQRKQWFKWNDPKTGEQMRGNTLFKFLYGNSIEEMVLYLAKEAGHDVSSEQERVEWTHPNGWTISGRIDAVIDGVLIDVKSTSSYGFKEYRQNGVTPSNDSFGYRYQLSGYYHFKTNRVLPEQLEVEKEGAVLLQDAGECRLHSSGENVEGPHAGVRAGFLFADKQNGDLLVSTIDPIPRSEIENEIDRIVTAVGAPSYTDIDRGYVSILVGKGGNEGLGFECSYCPFKAKCWPGLRGFAYSHGPVYLTKVVNEPKVPEFKVGA